MRVLARLAAAVCLGTIGAAAIAATALGNEHCELEVEPASGPAGTEFVLSGTGYSPTEMLLRKDGGEPTTIPLELPDGSFQIPVASDPGDEGRWTATVNDPAADCSVSVEFLVTLHDTAAAANDAAGGGAGLPPLVYLLVIATGVAAGVRIARYRQATPG